MRPRGKAMLVSNYRSSGWQHLWTVQGVRDSASGLFIPVLLFDSMVVVLQLALACLVLCYFLSPCNECFESICLLPPSLTLNAEIVKDDLACYQLCSVCSMHK